MQWLESIGVRDFLARHSSIRIKDLSDSYVELEGGYDLYARFEDDRVIKNCIELRIIIPCDYPRAIPIVYEISNQFPRTPDYHTYKDGSLCLTSEIRLRIACIENPKFADFFDAIIEPCLLSIDYKIKFGVTPFGELEHGEDGLIEDYEKLFGVKGKESVILTLKALGSKYREANKLKCPCKCGVRLGRCSLRFRLKSMRKVIKRKWYREHLASNFTPIPKRQKLITKVVCKK